MLWVVEFLAPSSAKCFLVATIAVSFESISMGCKFFFLFSFVDTSEVFGKCFGRECCLALDVVLGMKPAIGGDLAD